MTSSCTSNKKILVTGCPGFIGGHLAEKLMKRGDKVVAVDLINDYYNPELKKETLGILEAYNSELAQDGGKKFSFYKTDLCKEDEVRQVFKNEAPFDCVVHLAAQAGVRFSVDNPVSVIQTNIVGTQVVFEIAREFKVPYIVAASSSSVYGISSTAPFSENQTCNQPISPYAATKRSNELFAFTFNHLYGVPVSMLRFFTVYGPRGRPDMAAYKFIDKISKGVPIDKFGDGSMIREFTYIDDIVNGVVSSIDTYPTDNKVRLVNLGGGATHTLNNFIESIEKHVGKSAQINQMPVQPGDVHITSACQVLASKELGFKPEISLDEGIRRTVDWYKNCPYLNK